MVDRLASFIVTPDWPSNSDMSEMVDAMTRDSSLMRDAIARSTADMEPAEKVALLQQARLRVMALK